MSKAVVTQFFKDLFYFPSFGRGAICIWKRNLLYFKYMIVPTLTWIFVEPLLYLFALGYGLGRFVTEIDGMTYPQFIAPGMLAITGMFVSFFEGTYSTYTKLSRQNTYQTIILTPISTDEVVLGEILWVSTKAFLSVASVAIVFLLLGLISPMKVLPALLVLGIMCWVFAAMGVWLASLAKSYEWFTYSQSGLITPMSLFCGTYFPLSQLPQGILIVSYLLPLTHGLMAARMFLAGQFNSNFFINIFYLLFCAVAFTNLSAARFQRKLIT